MPSNDLASLKFTTPQGPHAPVTVDVKVTFWPKVDGFREEAMVVVVFLPTAGGFTTCTKIGEMLELQLVSPA